MRYYDDCEGFVKSTVFVLLSPEEKEALGKKCRESGVKKYRLVRDWIVEGLRKDGYLPKEGGK